MLMPSGCRMGICYGCVLPMREGAVRDLRTGDVTTAAAGDNVKVQTCISAAAGACDLDHWTPLEPPHPATRRRSP